MFCHQCFSIFQSIDCLLQGFFVPRIWVSSMSGDSSHSCEHISRCIFQLSNRRKTVNHPPSINIDFVNSIIPNKRMQIQSALFFEWVSIGPRPCAGFVVTIAVVKEVRFIVIIFRREPYGIGLGHRSGCPNDFPEGAFDASP